jgi:hypothetical protein
MKNLLLDWLGEFVFLFYTFKIFLSSSQVSFLWFNFQEIFSANAAALASRKSSPRVNNEAVQKAVCTWLVFFFALMLSSRGILLYLF